MPPRPGINTPLVAILTAVAIAAAVGCYPSSKRWEMAYPPPGMETARSRHNAPERVEVVVMPFTDARLDMDITKSPVIVTPRDFALADWAHEAAAFELERAGYTVTRSMARSPAAPDAVLRGEVVSADCPDGKNCLITVGLRFSRGGRELINRRYTGTYRVPFPRPYTQVSLSWALFDATTQMVEDVHAAVRHDR